MQLSQIPLRMQKAWGAAAGGAYIRTVPVASQIGIADGAASFTDGFVPDNFTPVAGGGVPPFGQDMNGALNAITSWDQWLQAGGAIGYDATFSAAIGGYPKNCVLSSNVAPGVQWYSTVDNNLTNPDDPLTSSGWGRVGIPVGTPVPLFGPAVAGFILANGMTFGSSSSGSPNPADAFLFLFVAIWNQFSNTQCPIFDSAGGVSTRGANAVSDFLANKRLTMPNMKGLGVIGVDTMGGSASTFLNGVPVTSGNTTTPGSIIGENLHTLITSETPVITPTGSISNGAISGVALNVILGGTSGGGGVGGGGSFGLSGNASLSVSQGTSTFTGNTHGSGGAHNTVERNILVNWGLRI
jgi:hypothetical protein